MQPAAFPYPYAIKRSARAKYVRLVVSSEGFVIVVPQKFCVSRDLAPILESKKEWIQKNLEKLAAHIGAKATEGKVFPQTVELKALAESWHIKRCFLERERLREKEVGAEKQLLLTSDYNDAEALTALRRWILSKARLALPPRLRWEADQHGFAFSGVVVKEQKSLWGSCSSKGNINLNARLLFLEPALVRHVMLHELCHLREMNHSPAFYKLLSSCNPQAEKCAAKLKNAWDLIPRWAL